MLLCKHWSIYESLWYFEKINWNFSPGFQSFVSLSWSNQTRICVGRIFRSFNWRRLGVCLFGQMDGHWILCCMRKSWLPKHRGEKLFNKGTTVLYLLRFTSSYYVRAWLLIEENVAITQYWWLCTSIVVNEARETLLMNLVTRSINCSIQRKILYMLRLLRKREK